MTWVQYGVPAQAGHAIGLDIMGYVVGWLAFALLSFHLAPMFGCGRAGRVSSPPGTGAT